MIQKRSISRLQITHHETTGSPRLDFFLKNTQIPFGNTVTHQHTAPALGQLSRELRRGCLESTNTWPMLPGAQFRWTERLEGIGLRVTPQGMRSPIRGISKEQFRNSAYACSAYA